MKTTEWTQAEYDELKKVLRKLAEFAFYHKLDIDVPISFWIAGRRHIAITSYTGISLVKFHNRDCPNDKRRLVEFTAVEITEVGFLKISERLEELEQLQPIKYSFPVDNYGTDPLFDVTLKD